MNNKNLILFFLIISILFTTIGCSDFYGDLSTDLRFKIDLNGLQLNSRSRTQTTEPAKLSVELTSKDNLVTLKQEQDIITNTTNYFTFENIEIGTTIKITATILQDDEKTFFGETEWFEVKPTDNFISLTLEKINNEPDPPSVPTVTLTFNVNDETWKTLSGTIGETLPDIGTPTKEGYDFISWEPELPEVFPKEDTNYNATWTKVYSITYYLNDGIQNPNNPNSYTYSESSIPLYEPTKTGYDFVDWYVDETYIVNMNSIPAKKTGDITLYAKWTPNGQIASWTDLKYKLSDTEITEFEIIKDLVATETITISKPVKISANKDVTISRDEGFTGVFFVVNGTDNQNNKGSLELKGNDNVYITLNGNNAAKDPLLWIYSQGKSLTLENCILENNLLNNLDSGYGNGGAIKVESDFTMNNSSIINCSANVHGGAVYIFNGGTLTMNGGAISNCTATEYGTVYINTGTFTINEGTICGCTATDGGAVYIASGSFIMNDRATISNCTAKTDGGGVYIASGSFTMESGSISSCTAGSGGGVYVAESGTFTMKNGTIAENIAESETAQGAGVKVLTGTFIMEGGSIENNILKHNGSNEIGGGAGVAIFGSMSGSSVNKYGTFQMNSGSISGNTIEDNNAYGTGVYVYTSGKLEMSGTANVNANNEVYLNGASITIAGDLTSEEVATIALPEYTTNTQVLTAGTDITLTADIANKFTISDTNYTINAEGKIQQN